MSIEIGKPVKYLGTWNYPVLKNGEKAGTLLVYTQTSPQTWELYLKDPKDPKIYKLGETLYDIAVEKTKEIINRQEKEHDND